MRFWPASLALLLGAVTVVVVRAPAAWLTVFLPPPLQAQFVSGSVWAGQMVVSGRGLACPLAWSVREAGWLWVGVDARLASPCEGAARITFTPDAIRATKVRLTTGVAQLTEVLPALQSWRPGGTLQLSADQLQLAPLTRGRLQLEWREVKFAGLPVATFGDYAAATEVEGTQLRGSVHTLKGPLMLEGTFEISQNARADLRASSTDPRIEGWIKTLGIPDGSGGYHLRMP